MKFSEIYQSKRYVYSLEFFPPKKSEELNKTLELVEKMAKLQPDYMTVTYGAAGGTRDLTKKITSHIANELAVPAVAHLTCVGHTQDEIDRLLDEYHQIGIKHILALRGDPPKESNSFRPVEGGFHCARDLASHIQQRGDFSIAVAGYPETHQDATSPEEDLKYLAQKVDAGGEIVLTQLFFDVSVYRAFTERAKSIGITAPIVPGIMPISNVGQVKRFTSLCGATIPDALMRNLEEIAEDKEEVVRFGTEYALQLCHDLLETGAPGIHFYTLNRSKQVAQILQQLPRA